MASKRYFSEIEQRLANIFLRMNSYAFNGICLAEKEWYYIHVFMLLQYIDEGAVLQHDWIWATSKSGIKSSRVTSLVIFQILPLLFASIILVNLYAYFCFKLIDKCITKCNNKLYISSKPCPFTKCIFGEEKGISRNQPPIL